jgi:hypothetical protein
LAVGVLVVLEALQVMLGQLVLTLYFHHLHQTAVVVAVVLLQELHETD